MKQLQFSDGLEEYSLNGRVTVRFNPTDASFLERLAELFSLLLALTEEVESAMQGELSAREARIAKYTAKYKK